MGKHSKHAHHDHELPKLNRIGGQIEGVKKMIAENRNCADIITQLRAVRAAVRRVEADILEAHLQSCVSDAFTHGDRSDAAEKISELTELFKRFDS